MPQNENGLSKTSCQTWKLICINAVTAGLEVVSSVVFTIVPPLLLKLGYSETQMSLLFGVGKNIATSVVSQNLEIKLVEIEFKLMITLIFFSRTFTVLDICAHSWNVVRQMHFTFWTKASIHLCVFSMHNINNGIAFNLGMARQPRRYKVSGVGCF